MKKILSTFLIMALLVCFMPTMAFAETEVQAPTKFKATVSYDNYSVTVSVDKDYVITLETGTGTEANEIDIEFNDVESLGITDKKVISDTVTSDFFDISSLSTSNLTGSRHIYINGVGYTVKNDGGKIVATPDNKDDAANAWEEIVGKLDKDTGAAGSSMTLANGTKIEAGNKAFEVAADTELSELKINGTTGSDAELGQVKITLGAGSKITTDGFRLVVKEENKITLDIKNLKEIIFEKEDTDLGKVLNVLLKAASADAAVPPVIGGNDKDNVTTETKPIVDGKTEVTTSTEGTVTVTENTSVVSVDSTTADKLVEKALAAEKEAKKAGAKEVTSTIVIDGTKANNDKVEVALPADTVKRIYAETEATVKVITPSGDLEIDRNTIKTITEKEVTGTVNIVLEKMAQAPDDIDHVVGEDAIAYQLKIVTSQGTISNFDGGIINVSLRVPKSMEGKKIAVVHVSDDGIVSKMPGKTVKLADGYAYKFPTNHFSYFALLDEETAEKMVADQKAKFDRIKEGVKNTTLKASSTAAKSSISLTWTKSRGYKVDGYEVFKSTKRYSGFGKTAYFKTTKTTYKNTKELKKGTRYFYKVRGYRMVGNEKVYTAWSNKAYRTVK